MRREPPQTNVGLGCPPPDSVKHRSRRRGLVLVLLVLTFALAVFTGACSGGTLDQARKAEQAGDTKTAVELYRQCLEEEPENLQALKGLAVHLYLLGDFDGALPMQERAVALDKKDAQIRVELAFNYLNHQDAPAKAVGALSEAAGLDPSARVVTFLAQAQIAAGWTTDAEASLREAIGADPAYGRAYAVLIGLLEDQGRASDADEVVRKAQEAGVTLDDGK